VTPRMLASSFFSIKLSSEKKQYMFLTKFRNGGGGDGWDVFAIIPLNKILQTLTARWSICPPLHTLKKAQILNSHGHVWTTYLDIKQATGYYRPRQTTNSATVDSRTFD
jgi:hypothetical protein